MNSKLRFSSCVAATIWLLLSAIGPSHMRGDDLGFTFWGSETEMTIAIADSSNLSDGLDWYAEGNLTVFEDEYVDSIGIEGGASSDGAYFGPIQQDIELDDAYIEGGAPLVGGLSYSVQASSYVCVNGGYGEITVGTVDSGDCWWDFTMWTTLTAGVPSISTISPSSDYLGKSGQITLTGQYLGDPFGGGFTSYDITGSGVSLSGGTSSPDVTSYTLNYSIAQNASVGPYYITITNPFGTSNSIAFGVSDPNSQGPVITGIDPSSVEPGDTVQLNVTGTGFGTNPSLNVSGSGIGVSNVQGNDTWISATLSVDPSAPAPQTLQVTVTANAYNGQAFNPVTRSGSTGTSAPANVLVVPQTVYRISPSILNLSTGDTGKTLSVSASGNAQISSVDAYVSALSSNNCGQCAVSLSPGSPNSSTTTVTASPAGCSGIFQVDALINGSSTTNNATVIVPPQELVQVLYGEADSVPVPGSVQQVLMETLGNAIGMRDGDPNFNCCGNDSWQDAIASPGQFNGYNANSINQASGGPYPELDAAARVFSQAGPVNTALTAGCFFSPDASGWHAIRQAMAAGATQVPSVRYDPSCYGGASVRQYIIKSSTGAYGDGRPFFIFVQGKNSGDPAVIQIN